jgi:hypothetical protein
LLELVAGDLPLVWLDAHEVGLLARLEQWRAAAVITTLVLTIVNGGRPTDRRDAR